MAGTASSYRIGLDLGMTADIASFDPKTKKFYPVIKLETNVGPNKKVLNIVKVEKSITVCFRENRIDFSLYMLINERTKTNGICLYANSVKIKNIHENYSEGFIEYISEKEISKMWDVIMDFRTDFMIDQYINFSKEINENHRHLFISVRDTQLKKLVTFSKATTRIYLTKKEYGIISMNDLAVKTTINNRVVLSGGLVTDVKNNIMNVYYRTVYYDRSGLYHRLFAVKTQTGPSIGSNENSITTNYMLEEIEGDEKDRIINSYIRDQKISF